MEKVSVIVPAHNEAKTLAKNIKALERELEEMLGDFEIIISEDGSTDPTAEVCRSLVSERIKILSNERRLGKGEAIRKAASVSCGSIIIFMDADMSTKTSQVPDLLRFIQEGAAVVVGSRYLKGSKAKRSLSRLAASKAFNWLMLVTCGSKVSDHQCGFKGFRKDLVLPIIAEIDDPGWFWDAELIIRTQRKGLKVVEIPIEWNEGQDSKFRIVNDSLHMAYCLARFKVKNG